MKQYGAEFFGTFWLVLGGCGSAVLAASFAGPAHGLGIGFVGVSLAVPDIFGAHKALTDRGVEFIAPPEKQPWGGVLAHLRDPDGNVITLLGGAK